MVTGSIFIDLVIILVTFFCAGFFVACEFALVQTRTTALQEELDDENTSTKRKRKLTRELHMVKNLNEYLSTTQVGVSLAGIILGWIGESFAIAVFVRVLGHDGMGTPSATAHGIGAILGIIVLTYLEVVFTEILPKNLSIDMPLKVLNVVSTPLHYCHVIFYPFVWLLNVSASGVVKLLGLPVANENDEALSQSEILSVSKAAVQNGDLEQNDYLYMRRAFELNDKTARDIMIDRTQLKTIDVNDTVSDAIETYLSTKFSRLPVVKDNDKDDILGYVYIYDLIKQSQINPDKPITTLIRKIDTTSETTTISIVLQQMIKNHQPIVVVIDEYGGTSGIITDKDIYEELFGTVRDEIDPSSHTYIFKQPSGSYKISGKLNTYDFEKYFDTQIKEFNESDIVTIAGFVIDHYPHIEVGDVVQIGHFNFKVLDYENSFINWFEVTEAPVTTDDDSEEH
ncbi:hemolysin family protein [Fructilactobacillus cliffordii]|uniref:hemolysin family protein n=1 Tax=Fructilactobacillus cliffordii TaxID=2940299 RepID=UPI002093DE69|nr:hemolysin family protein [Fructilactobacillus cliffordii]USS86036.1 hemolysin family protein [Fructilactobacillus cliffordii]